MEKTTRRNVLRSSAAVTAIAVGAASGQLASCSSTGGIVINPAVLTAIQSAVVAACSFVPTVESIVAIVGVSFPAVAGVATISTAVLQEISTMFCAAVPTPAAAGKLHTLSNGVAIHGYVVGPDGKLVYV